jgi:hypothetical protein
MNEFVRKLLQENELENPPTQFNDSFYEWLNEVQEKLGVSFISRAALAQEDLALLIRALGDVPAELHSYYLKSTPWDYNIEEYFDRMNYIRAEYLERLVAETGEKEKEIKSKLTESKTLWPIEIYRSSYSALAFLDHAGRLVIISGDIRGGFGLGRPLSIGLRNYFVMRVITQLAWYETDGEKSYAEVGCRPEILDIGGLPLNDPSKHILIEYFNLMLNNNKS